MTTRDDAEAIEALKHRIRLSEHHRDMVEADIPRRKGELWGGTEVGSDD